MAESTFFLRVIASDKVFFKDYAKSVAIESFDGRRQFLAHHQEMMAAVSPGELVIETAEGERIAVVAGFGSMVFANNRCTVLVDTCETPEELDARRAQEALDRAQERMRQKQSMREYKMSQAAMARALSRLKFKGKQID